MVDKLEALSSRHGFDKNLVFGSDVLVLPENVDNVSTPEELHDTDHCVHLAKHLRQKGFKCRTAFDLGLRPRVLERRGVDVWLGVLWIVNSALVPTLVSVLASYIYDCYVKSNRSETTSSDAHRVHVTLRVQRSGSTSSIDFSGSCSDFLRILSAFAGEEKAKDGTEQ